MEWTFEYDNNASMISVYQTNQPNSRLIGYTYNMPKVTGGMVVAPPGSPYPVRVVVSFADGSTAEYVKGMAAGFLELAR
jgi:hypothetical protein